MDKISVSLLIENDYLNEYTGIYSCLSNISIGIPSKLDYKVQKFWERYNENRFSPKTWEKLRLDATDEEYKKIIKLDELADTTNEVLGKRPFDYGRLIELSRKAFILCGNQRTRIIDMLSEAFKSEKIEYT